MNEDKCHKWERMKDGSLMPYIIKENVSFGSESRVIELTESDPEKKI